MRTTQLKINNEKKEAVLVAGGPGFKIYTANGVDGWVVVLGREVHLIEESRPEFDAVGKYVNLRYQAQAEQDKIKTAFDALVKVGFQLPQMDTASAEAVPESEIKSDRPVTV